MLNQIKCFFFGHKLTIDFNNEIFDIIPTGFVIRRCHCCGELFEIDYQKVSDYMYDYTIEKLK